MTRKSMILNVAVFAMAVAPAFATVNDNLTSHLDQIAAAAKQTQVEAQEVSNLLRAKVPDFERVNGKMKVLAEHSGQVNRLIQEFEAAHPSLTASQAAEFNRVKELAQLVNIFITNKNTMLASQNRERGILRAKAEGIAKRAEMLHQAVLRIRS